MCFIIEPGNGALAIELYSMLFSMCAGLKYSLLFSELWNLDDTIWCELLSASFSSTICSRELRPAVNWASLKSTNIWFILPCWGETIVFRNESYIPQLLFSMGMNSAFRPPQIVLLCTIFIESGSSYFAVSKPSQLFLDASMGLYHFSSSSVLGKIFRSKSVYICLVTSLNSFTSYWRRILFIYCRLTIKMKILKEYRRMIIVL